MFKWIRRIIFLTLILGLIFFTKNLIAKFAIEKGVEKATGLKIKLKAVDLGLRDTHFGVRHLTLFNPAGYHEDVLFEAPEIFVDYDFAAVVKGKIHLQEVRLELDHLVVIKNDKGQLNLNALKPQKSPEEKAAKTEKTGEKSSKKKQDMPEFQIDHMIVKIGKVVYKDYSQGGAPVVKEYPINVYEKFDNINGADQFIGAIVQKALVKTTLANLVNFDSDFLKGAASGIAVKSFKEKVESFKEKVVLPFDSK